MDREFGDVIYTKDLIRCVASDTGLRLKDAKLAVMAVMSIIEEAMIDGKRVQLTNFGTFEMKERSARTGRNPHDGSAVPIPARIVPTFEPGNRLKQVSAESL